MLELDILNIVPSAVPGTPSYIEVSGDFAANFHGREWIDEAGTRYPFYSLDNDAGTATPAPPYGTVVLQATTFQVTGNTKYDGFYTVYTKTSPSDYDPSTFSSGSTKVYIVETIPAGTGTELTDGKIINVSTYRISTGASSYEVVLEKRLNTNGPVPLIGRSFAGWGEAVNQTMVDVTRCHAGPSSPMNPYVGMLWFNTTNSVMYVFSGGWNILNAAAFGGSYRHDQLLSATTWTVNHNLNLPSPFICQHQFFVVRAGQTKPINPADVTYVNANTFTVTFSSPEVGYVIARS